MDLDQGPQSEAAARQPIQDLKTWQTARNVVYDYIDDVRVHTTTPKGRADADFAATRMRATWSGVERANAKNAIVAEYLRIKGLTTTDTTYLRTRVLEMEDDAAGDFDMKKDGSAGDIPNPIETFKSSAENAKIPDSEVNTLGGAVANAWIDSCVIVAERRAQERVVDEINSIREAAGMPRLSSSNILVIRLEELNEARRLLKLGSTSPAADEATAELADAYWEYVQLEDRGVQAELKAAQAAAIRQQNAAQSNSLDQRTMDMMKILKETFSGGGNYGDFIDLVDRRDIIDAKHFATLKPGWYRELPPRHKDAVTAAMNVNLIAGVKKQEGHTDLAAVIGLKVEMSTKDLQAMFELFPTYRIALATMMHDLFDIEASTGTLILKSGAVERLKDQNYETDMVDRIRAAVEERPEVLERISAGNGPVLDAEQAAVLGEALARNFICATDAIDSADRARELGPQSTGWYGEQTRTMSNLGAKGIEAKWGVSGKSGKSDKAPVYFGGAIGEYIAVTSALEGDSFAKRVRNGEVNLIPRKLTYSQLDMTEYPDRIGYLSGKTLAQVLANTSDMVDLGDGLFDYAHVDPHDPKAISFTALGVPDIRGGYADIQSAVMSIQAQLTIKRGEKPRETIGDIVNALNKVRESALLRPIYTGRSGEDVVRALQANFLGGLVPGVPSGEGVLAGIYPGVSQGNYDNMVLDVLSSGEWYSGLPRGAEERNLRWFNAHDTNTRAGANASLNEGTDTKMRGLQRVRGGRRVTLFETSQTRLHGRNR